MDDCCGALIHGGDAQSFVARYGMAPLDLSANVNPLGVPDGVRRAICQAAIDADRYPDPICRDLRSAIANSEGIKSHQIFCAAGAAEIIYRLALALKPKHALIPAPTFAEYKLALSRQGCAVERHLLQPEDEFTLTQAILPQLHAGIDVMFLCNPNNPTGKLIDTALLETVLARCEKYNIWLVVDECFLGFTPKPEAHTLKPMLLQYKKLVVLKAFTKIYGMAGVRLGYCLCNDVGLIQRLYEVGPPWNVSSLAQRAGIAALSERDYLKESRMMIAAERPRVQAALTAVGFHVVTSETNYILFFCPLPQFGEKLCQMGVLIRSCANFEGLGEGWYRVAVRTPPENNRLILAIKQITEGIQ
ncbi:threonine-phosphate decarboxylase CobD [Oscillospiraceae bacterium LTW-04]|nr:threonine-phosphate decarboxylase CobD [Oscillospiraceae bacterium MB24-C1]